MSDWKPMPGEPIYVADYADGPWYQAIFVRQGNKQFPYGTGQPGNMHYWPFARPVNGEVERLRGLLREAIPHVGSFDDASSEALLFRIQAALGEG